MMSRYYRITCWIVVAAMGAGLTGCQTMNEHRTATGATTGAVAGATAGALIDKDNPLRGALIGLAAGAAIGGGIGHILQKQKEAFDRIEDVEAQQQTVLLQTQQAGQEEPQTEEKAALLVRMQSEVLFEVGSSALSAAGVAKVKEVAEILRQYPDSDCFVAGYTSSEGDDQMNYELSLRRATVVKNELIADGVAATRLQALGMGESDPIGDNNTESGRVMNRRVEIVIVPRDQ